MSTQPQIRELDQRSGDGIEVRLLWNACTNTVSIAVEDTRAGDSLEFEVDPASALAAFRHPYAHAASSGVSGTGLAAVTSCL